MLLREKKEIEDWLNKYEIKYYKLIEDKDYGYIVNVNADVYLCNQDLVEIKIKFNKVTGYFDCSENLLTSLKGCPEIVDGNFYYNYNKLKTLKGCPEIVGIFNCSYNRLESLEGCPQIINKDFYCNHNKLTSLKGCPEIIEGKFTKKNKI